MFCGNCGNKIDDNDKFCPDCGACIIRRQNADMSSDTSTTVAKPSDSEGDTLAIAGFIFAFIFPLVGLILCILALGKTTRYQVLARAGKIISIIALALSILSVVITVVVFMSSLGMLL